MSSELAICVRGATRSFRSGFGFHRSKVLHGIDLEVERGATLGLLGPNGSGKSTLLRILAGVDRESSGSVEVLGRAPNSNATLLATGYLPEDSPFPQELNADQALELLGSLQGLSRTKIRKRADELLARVGLEGARNRALGKYSRGMLRRFGLAQAWLHDPELILFDEPTAGLDAQGFEVLDSLLREAREKGTTVVLTSHLLTDLADYCTHLAVLVDGAIAANDAPDELLRDEKRVQLEIEGLAPDRFEALTSWLEEQGARCVSRGAGTRTLLDVYRRIGATRQA